MAKRTPPVILLLLGYGAAACSSAAESPPPSQVSDSAGWRIVQSSSPSSAKDQIWTVSPQPDLVIGALEGPEEYQFVQITDAARLSDGSVVVVDQGAQVVRLYHPDGTLRKTLGGPGGGPGEFTDPVSVLVTANDTVVIWDQALLRATRFTPFGDLASVQTMDWGKLANLLGVEMATKGGGLEAKSPEVPSGLFPGPMEPLADGGFLVRLVEKVGVTPGSGRYRPRSGALRISGDLSVVDTLMLFGDTEQVVVDAPWGPFSLTPPGAKQTQTAQSPTSSQICIGTQEGLKISCFGTDRAKTSIRWRMEPVPLAEADVSVWREQTVRFLTPKLSRDQVLEILDQVPVPKSRPPFSRIFLDPTGDLWVELGPTRGGSGDSSDFLVFGPDGILLGISALPPIRILEIGQDHVLGVYEDELEIQYLHVHNLRKSLGRTE
jgi:hypothetical protein